MVGWLGLLALPALDRPVGFSEKGLQAGVASPTLGNAAHLILPSTLPIAQNVSDQHLSTSSAQSLLRQLRALGLPTQLTTSHVLSGPGPRTPCACHNLHTLIRARRGDGTEALAYVTPLAFAPQRYDSAYDGRTQDADAAALAVLTGATLAVHLAGLRGGDVEWLARDVLWVVPDMACGAHQCLSAWADEYHQEWRGLAKQTAAAAESSAGASSRSSNSSGLGRVGGGARGFARGGVVQQAVVLEVLAGAGRLDTGEVVAVGYDGLLPKLDVPWLMRYLFYYPARSALWRDDQVEALLRGPLAPWLQGWRQESVSYVSGLLQGLAFAWQQAVGLPGGPHAAFKRYMADAATLRLVQRTPRAPGSPSPSLRDSALALGSSLELCLRSLNNLAERMTHSPFLWLATQHGRHVTVERYVGPAAALAAELQLQAAWSMRQAVQLAGHGGQHQHHAGVWGAAAARALTRVAVLGAAAAGARALVCGDVGSLGPAATAAAAAAAAGQKGASPLCRGPLAALSQLPMVGPQVEAAARRVLSLQLGSPDGLVAAGGLWMAAAAAAAVCAGVAGRLVQRGVGVGRPGQRRGGATGSRETRAAGQGGEGNEVDGLDRKGAAAAAAWHAERVLVLTCCAASLAALVCLNWAAAWVAGAYLAPLALWQGFAALTVAVVEQKRSSMAVRAFVWVVVWLAVCPVLFLAAVALAFPGAGAPPLTVADGVCGMSLTGHLYAHVVAGGFWLFGLGG